MTNTHDTFYPHPFPWPGRLIIRQLYGRKVKRNSETGPSLLYPSHQCQTQELDFRFIFRFIRIYMRQTRTTVLQEISL